MAINQKHTLLTDFCRDISFTGDIARDFSSPFSPASMS